MKISHGDEIIASHFPPRIIYSSSSPAAIPWSSAQTIAALLAVFLILPPFASAFSAGNASPLLPGPEEYAIILFHHPVSRSDINAVRALGVSVHRAYTIIPALSVRLPAEALAVLSKTKGVRAILEDLPMRMQLNESVPQIRADTLHARGVRGAGAKVCVVDTGIEDGHAAIAPVLAEYDFVNQDLDASDDNGHGTHVAGIIASQNAVYEGVAPQAFLLAAKVLDDAGSGRSSDVIAGIEWCVRQHADVINMSLGGGSYTSACDNEAVSMAANQAVEEGVTVVAASGNSGRPDRISSPACASNVIAVGAVDKDDTHASYSNGGGRLDVVAPGTGIVSAYPPNRFLALTGTSMAAPHVSGLAAGLLSVDPGLSPEGLRSLLRRSAADLGAAGFDTTYGYGRIDAARAYDMLTGVPEPPSTTEQVFSDTFADRDLKQWIFAGVPGWSAASPSAAIPGSPAGNLVAHAEGCRASCSMSLRDPLDLSGFTEGNIRFQRFVDRNLDAGEHLRLDAFDGSAWSALAEWTDGAGDDSAWQTTVIALPSRYLVKGFSLRFVSRESSAIEETEVDDVTVTGTATGDRPPVANAGRDIAITDSDGDGAEIVALDGSASSDDGTIVSYAWSSSGGLIGTGATLERSFAIGTRIVTLTVTDNAGVSDSDSVLVSVAENAPPAADAGRDIAITDSDGDGAEIVALDGSASSDDGTIVSYAWSEDGRIIGTGAVVHVPVSVGVHIIRLLVEDNAGARSDDTVSIVVIQKLLSSTVFTETFADFGNWTASGIPGWSARPPKEQPVPGSDGGNTVAHADDCAEGCVLTLSRPLNLSGGDAVLTFRRLVDRSLDNGEYLRVEAFDGVTWRVLAEWTDGSGDDDLWNRESVPLPAQYLSANFLLRFTARMSSSIEDAELDDVTVTVTPPAY